MTRIFLPPEQLASKQITITGEQSRYLSLVLRAKPGEQLTIFDGTGRRYICRMNSVHKKEVIAEKIREETYSAESPVSIILAQGIPKGDKMDLIVQKSTELGVKKIIPIITEHSQVRATGKTERWRKIALAASQQSGREKVPDMAEPVDFKEFIEGRTADHKIIFSAEEKKQNLSKTLNSFQSVKEITLLIGPEGGFSKDETRAAIQKGFASVSLGPRILRTETAPITAISIVQYELGDLG